MTMAFPRIFCVVIVIAVMMFVLFQNVEGGGSPYDNGAEDEFVSIAKAFKESMDNEKWWTM